MANNNKYQEMVRSIGPSGRALSDAHNAAWKACMKDHDFNTDANYKSFQDLARTVHDPSAKVAVHPVLQKPENQHLGQNIIDASHKLHSVLGYNVHKHDIKDLIAGGPPPAQRPKEPHEVLLAGSKNMNAMNGVPRKRVRSADILAKTQAMKQRARGEEV